MTSPNDLLLMIFIVSDRRRRRRITGYSQYAVSICWSVNRLWRVVRVAACHFLDRNAKPDKSLDIPVHGTANSTTVRKTSG